LYRIGLALLVGAVLHDSAFAQVRPDTARRGRDSIAVRIPLPPDSAKADSVIARERADSIRAAREARRAADSVKTPLTGSELPISPDIGKAYRWTRDELFASGALTLGELLGRVPGVSGFASGWIATPHVNTYVGDFKRIRLFYDGVEMDPLDTRVGQGIQDLSAIPMWTLEELVVERAAEELRVHIRSWRVTKTTPYTRVDVATGDFQTNSYRGFFGRRFSNGMALQVGAQQYSTEDPRDGGDGDHLGLLGRFGWAKKKWSADATVLRTHQKRTEQLRDEQFDVPGDKIPPLDASRTEAYVRVGYGDVSAPLWLQFIAATSRFSETNQKTTTTGTPTGTPTGGVTGNNPAAAFAGDTVDTTASRAQYVATGGLRLGDLSVSATGRLRLFRGLWFLTPSARASYDRGIISVSAYGEQQVSDSTFRADVTARLTPLEFLSIAGSVGKTSALENSETPPSLAYRGEVGVRVGRLWVTGGVMSLDTTVVPAPIVYDTLYKPVTVGSRRATFATLRGPVWKGIGLDIVALKWPKDADSSYIPEYQVRSSIYAETSWLSKFPEGNFHILARITHDYRTEVQFPLGGAQFQHSNQYRTFSSLLELRLYDAVISWQYRNVMGEIYQVIPGFLAPRAINYYGVRWDFFN
jgi:hypothetical protein